MAQVTFVATLAPNFRTAIETEGVGYEDDFGSHAELSEDGKVWTTYWSGYTYTDLGSGGRFCYQGALRGFLAQSLLPDFGETTIEKVEGTYGSFEGVDTLTQYKCTKARWEEACRPVLRSAFARWGITLLNYEQEKLFNSFFVKLWKEGFVNPPATASELPPEILREIWKEYSRWIPPEAEIIKRF